MVKLMKFAIAVIGSLLLTPCLGGGGGGNSAPVATADTQTVAEDSGTTPIDVLAKDTDADGETASKAFLPAIIMYLLSDDVATPVTITHNGTTYSTVTSPYTGKVWLDRNLGAARVCESYDDTACYGDYYQWGRNFDGHEQSGSASTNTLATQIDPVQPAVQGEFITNSSIPYDWTADTVDNNGSIRTAKWLETDGSSVCPAGFRVPTIDELRDELLNPGSAEINGTTPSTDKRENAYASFLKLPSGGDRYRSSGTLLVQGGWGYLWSCSVDAYSHADLLVWGSDSAGWGNSDRANGLSVRCLRD